MLPNVSYQVSWRLLSKAMSVHMLQQPFCLQAEWLLRASAACVS
jgi:hypothetical protein